MQDASKAAGRNIHHLCPSVPGGEPLTFHVAHWEHGVRRACASARPLGVNGRNEAPRLSVRALIALWEPIAVMGRRIAIQSDSRQDSPVAQM
jgi:hypothetical protein